MDMDLDELDQAVSKLMVQPKKGKRVTHNRDAAPVRDAATPAPVMNEPAAAVKATPPAKPAPAHAVHESHTISVNRPMPKVPERHRTHPGAMDIIQPHVGPKAAPPSARPTRMASDVMPSNPTVKPEVPAPLEPPAPRVAEPPEPSAADVSDEVLASLGVPDAQGTYTSPKPAEPQKTSQWPDPLDFHDFNDDKDSKKEEKPEEPAPTMDFAPTKTDEPQNATPFLATKVEKRPLGAYADAEPPKAPVETPAKAELAETSLQSNQHIAATPKEEPEHDMDDLRQMTIPPQYHTAPADKNQEVHNVYDTKEYHAAPQMMPAAHKGGSPWVTVGIVVLVVLIIAAVAIGYFMMTGTFDITKLW
jgi:hypothetical protein